MKFYTLDKVELNCPCNHGAYIDHKQLAAVQPRLYDDDRPCLNTAEQLFDNENQEHCPQP